MYAKGRGIYIHGGKGVGGGNWGGRDGGWEEPYGERRKYFKCVLSYAYSKHTHKQCYSCTRIESRFAAAQKSSKRNSDPCTKLFVVVVVPLYFV